MKIKKITLALAVVALGCGGVAAVAANKYVKDQGDAAEQKFLSSYPTASFLVSRVALPAGMELSSEHIDVAVKFVNGIHADALTPGEEDLIVGMTAKTPLTPGAPILKSQLTIDNFSGLASKVEDNEGVVTIAVNPLSSQSGLLAPEDRVDVMFTTASQGRSTTNTFLTNMRVVATGQRVSSEHAEDINTAGIGFDTVSLACSTSDCQKLIHAERNGELSLVLRKGASSTGAYPDVTITPDILGHQRPKPRKAKKRAKKLEIYAAGERQS